MVCNKCKKNELTLVQACNYEVIYKCQNCGNEYKKKYDKLNFSIEFKKDNYDSPQEWVEKTIKAYSLHEEIPKDYLKKIKECKTWEDIEIIEKEVIPYLTR